MRIERFLYVMYALLQNLYGVLMVQNETGESTRKEFEGVKIISCVRTQQFL